MKGIILHRHNVRNSVSVLKKKKKKMPIIIIIENKRTIQRIFMYNVLYFIL